VWVDVWEYEKVKARSGAAGCTALQTEKHSMPLELRKQRDGRLRENWYARYEVNGKRFTVNLDVKITGTPPPSLSLLDQGDTEFQCSRTAAQMKLDSIVEEARSKRDSTHLIERIYESKTGEIIKSVKLTALADEWAKIARRRQVDDRYSKQCKSTLNRFAAFVREQNPRVVEMAQVTRTLTRAFMDVESERGVTGKTWNDTLKLLRATFKYLLPAGGINPFVGTPTRDTETVFRLPFSPEELAAISEAAKADEFIRSIIIVGMCTAMRRGDCCLLKWDDVDLPKRFITVKTSKTGQTVSIPIFPMLYDELKRKADSTPHPLPSPPAPLPSDGRGLRRALPGRGGEGIKRDGYVFPEQARMYLENPDGITWRVKKILAVGLGESVPDGPSKAESGKQKFEIEQVSTDETRKRGDTYIAKLPEGEKRSRMAAVFKLYMDGQNIQAVMAAANVSKGSVSGYLNEIEAAIGCRVVRGASRTGHQGESGNVKDGMKDAGLFVERKHGLRRASVRDFHSFRVTWVTLALTAGVPLELVQKVTGHKTTDIVLKHYFQPGREAFRSALNAAMPKLLMGGSAGGPSSEKQTTEIGKAEIGSPQPASGHLLPNAEKEGQDKKIRAILEHSTAKTWKNDQARMLKLLAEGQRGKS
jgi:integrase